MITRRKLLSGVPAICAVSTFSLASESVHDASDPDVGGSSVVTLTDGWQFRIDPSGRVTPPDGFEDSEWRAVSVPHTWQKLGETPEFTGTAWYRRAIYVPEEWSMMFARIEFEAVFHTAHVFLNGTLIGEHVGKGYTAFTCDLSSHLQYGALNRLEVRVDNSFSDKMLPRGKSFDWANDGGITRPVHVLISPKVFIERIEIASVPDMAANRADVSLKVLIRNTTDTVQHVALSTKLEKIGGGSVEGPGTSAHVVLAERSTQSISIKPLHISSPELWHFDHPHLYLAEVTLKTAGSKHVLAERFGIRKFEIRGTSFYLNGEKVALIGIERMAGSNPQYGMAEPTEWIQSNHRDMKNLNCVFTRAHWPQDRRVLDFCDEHGILMQEEVPAWGPLTFENASPELLSELTKNGSEQLGEMLARDRNHPCIVSWGLCNEVDGKNPNSRAFAHALAKEAKSIDPARLLTYASHTLRQNPGEDMAGDFDFISANEYFGSWYPGGPEQVLQFLRNIRKAFPDKPIVVSEYGWCECQPAIPPGDQNRANIIDDHTRVFRESGIVAGAIYFDYNDYRTIAGDKGTGALRQRVHGIVDLYANRKPSFERLRLEASPFERVVLKASSRAYRLEVLTREVLPEYTMRGYAVRWLFYGFDDLPMDGALEQIDLLSPGDEVSFIGRTALVGVKRVRADILRPTGYSAAAAEISL